MIKKSRRLHQLYQDWLKLKEMDEKADNLMRNKSKEVAIRLGLNKMPTMFERPLAGKWYYTYSNDRGQAVGLAKLQNLNFPFDKRLWMWETCTANEELELRRFPTQKKAEEEIYKFLK